MADCEVNEIVRLFNNLFVATFSTELIAGAEEPVYLPRTEIQVLNQILSSFDYCSSALHEISHWCIAGTERRKQVDYGYWYEPDGRSDARQKDFESLEVKPQALEWIFSESCGLNFRLSLDNVENPNATISEGFKEEVVQQALRYLGGKMPARAALFQQTLLDFYQEERPVLSPDVFTLSRLN